MVDLEQVTDRGLAPPKVHPDLWGASFRGLGGSFGEARLEARLAVLAF